MSIPEFKTADQVKSEAWENQYNKAFTDVLRLFDTALTHAKDNAPEGWGFTAEASIQGFSVKVTVSPPRASGGGWGGKGGPGSTPQAPPKFDKQGIEAVVTANMDTLNFKDEAGKLTVSPKKFLGDLWAGINDDLKKYGMKWISSGKQSRWEASP
jgi:hypothetical protein